VSRSRFGWIPVSLMMTLPCVIPLPTLAATGSGTSEPQSETISALAEIVVTAQKRKESVQDVGMSIQAESGAKLLKLGITDPSQLQRQGRFPIRACAADCQPDGGVGARRATPVYTLSYRANPRDCASFGPAW